MLVIGFLTWFSLWKSSNLLYVMLYNKFDPCGHFFKEKKECLLVTGYGRYRLYRLVALQFGPNRATSLKAYLVEGDLVLQST